MIMIMVMMVGPRCEMDKNDMTNITTRKFVLLLVIIMSWQPAVAHELASS